MVFLSVVIQCILLLVVISFVANENCIPITGSLMYSVTIGAVLISLAAYEGCIPIIASSMYFVIIGSFSHL